MAACISLQNLAGIQPAFAYVAQAACLQFYRRFLESPNFISWLERQRQAAFAAEAHQQALTAGSLIANLASLDDVQLVERFAQLEAALNRVTAAAAVGAWQRHHLLPQQAARQQVWQ